MPQLNMTEMFQQKKNRSGQYTCTL